jgi:hypothetical protein
MPAAWYQVQFRLEMCSALVKQQLGAFDHRQPILTRLPANDFHVDVGEKGVGVFSPGVDAGF